MCEDWYEERCIGLDAMMRVDSAAVEFVWQRNSDRNDLIRDLDTPKDELATRDMTCGGS
jgi:hypothetical protein